MEPVAGQSVEQAAEALAMKKEEALVWWRVVLRLHGLVSKTAVVQVVFRFCLLSVLQLLFETSPYGLVAVYLRRVPNLRDSIRGKLASTSVNFAPIGWIRFGENGF